MNEDQVKKIAKQVFDEQLAQTQYGFSSIPFHIHNQTDSPILPPTSVGGFVPLPANNPTGVVSPKVLNPSGPGTESQIVNHRATTHAQQPPAVYVFPVPIIYGYGVGGYSAFNGGDAPIGSLVCFSNAGTTAQLFIKVQTGESPDTFIWRGVTLPLTA